MSIKYRIFKDQKLVYAIGIGKVTLESLLGHLDDLAGDPDYRAPMKKLVDYRKTLPLILNTEECHKFTQHKAQYKDFFDGERCACITGNEIDFGMSRMHGFFIEEYNIAHKAFRDLDEALQWLQVDIDETELVIEQ